MPLIININAILIVIYCVIYKMLYYVCELIQKQYYILHNIFYSIIDIGIIIYYHIITSFFMLAKAAYI